MMIVRQENNWFNPTIPVGDITDGAASSVGEQTYAMPKMSITEIPSHHPDPNNTWLGDKRTDKFNHTW